MDKKIDASELLQTASDIWNFLKNQGGLNTRLYDTDLQEELRLRLGIPNQFNFEKSLDDISTEDFIVAFFQSVHPYGEMMSDLLGMFEKAGAKQTDKNMAISFNFEDDLPELKFDLSHFKQYVESWKKFSEISLKNKWNYKTIWSLNNILRKNEEKSQNPDLKQWRNQYLNQKIWPNVQLDIPCSGDIELDKIFVKVWRVWNEVVSESSKYGMERSILQDIFKKLNGLSENEREGLQKGQVRWTESKYRTKSLKSR